MTFFDIVFEDPPMSLFRSHPGNRKYFAAIKNPGFFLIGKTRDRWC
jgi:hypothetical protein